MALSKKKRSHSAMVVGFFGSNQVGILTKNLWSTRLKFSGTRMKFDPTHYSQSSKNLSPSRTKSFETVIVSRGSNVSVSLT